MNRHSSTCPVVLQKKKKKITRRQRWERALYNNEKYDCIRNSRKVIFKGSSTRLDYRSNACPRKQCMTPRCSHTTALKSFLCTGNNRHYMPRHTRGNGLPDLFELVIPRLQRVPNVVSIAFLRGESATITLMYCRQFHRSRRNPTYPFPLFILVSS